MSDVLKKSQMNNIYGYHDNDNRKDNATPKGLKLCVLPK